MTGIAFVGTGFVADYYMTTLANHPELKLIGVYDRASAELERFCAFYSASGYPSLDAMLDDGRVDIVINLTNPESHYEISRRALDKGKHVYSEKPLAMHLEEAEALVRFVRRRQPDCDEPVGVRQSQRLQQNRIDDTENECVRADTERQGGHCDKREPRSPAKISKAFRCIPNP